MGGGIPIGRLFGIPITLHATWFVVFLLVALSLNADLVELAPGDALPGRWLAAGGTALIFFASILLHELGHGVVALRHRVPVRSITLFIFGGVAVMEREPETPRAEFEIAAAGPLTSALLALFFSLLARAFPAHSVAATMLGWLSAINGMVVVFNLLPGFPLDGGRMLRAFLWSRRGDIAQATQVAGRAGRNLAYGFIALGALLALSARAFSGLWLAFIGWFLLVASRASMRQAAVDASLRGLRARDAMSPDVVWIDGSAPVGVFARELVVSGRRWALVGEPQEILGIATLADAERLERDQWEQTPVAEIATPAHRVASAAPGDPLREVLALMGTRQVNQIPVVESGRVLGAVTRDGLAQAIQMRRGTRSRTRPG
jgi:Zn-dependent protease